MGQDYYAQLGVSRGCDEATLKKAYKKLAMQYHPDRNPDDPETANRKFRDISHAYQVLSDPKKKEVYDRFGEQGINSGMDEVPQGPQFGGSRGASFRSHGPYGENMHFVDPNDLFAQMFRGAGATDDMFGGSNSSFGFGGARGSNRRSMPMRPSKAPDIEVDLELTLEELFTGCQKRRKITRRVLDAASNRTMSLEEIITIDIKAGYKAGTKIRYEEKGDERPGEIPADIVFRIQEKPHERFTRDRDDLKHKHTLPLKEALSGAIVAVETLDGKKFRIQEREVVFPGKKTTLSGYGMPNSKTGQRGDLIIEYDVKFPHNLTDEQKKTLAEIL
ncbi:DnaJ-like subfamily B member 4 [Porphyridium purpureum]|uniref:DnaJ-like subfamily B member 4 n=1 Tax=Porphyridium purpureum TaxID=35688 RepID=A0A5J4ZA35_PORPP|nr:DnaJ-like subfamily B member 4 [Porphyridium purpureum]|eukprot:POR5339..scf295_1